MDAARWFELAQEQIKKENYLKAKDLLDNVIQFDADHVDARAARAITCIHQGDYQQAKSDYDYIIRETGDIDIRLKRAGLLLILNKPVEARSEFEQVIEAEYKERDALKGIAKSYFLEKNYKKALQCYDQLLEEMPEDADAWYSKAETLYRYQDHEGAFEAIEKAITLETRPEFLAFKGDFYIRHENFERALEQYLLATKLDNNSKELHIRLSYIYRILKRPRDALRSLNRALELDSYNIDALENKRDILKQLNRDKDVQAIENQLKRLRS